MRTQSVFWPVLLACLAAAALPSRADLVPRDMSTPPTASWWADAPSSAMPAQPVSGRRMESIVTAVHAYAPTDGLRDMSGGRWESPEGLPSHGWAHGGGLTQLEPVSWSRGRLIGLGTLGGDLSVATGVNAHGQVVGHAQTAAGQTHAFQWDPRTRAMHDLGTLGGAFSYAQGVNDRGDVVGFSATRSGDVHAFLWSAANQVMYDLGTLGGKHSRAATINSRGVVIGFAQTADADDHAFLWDPDRRTMRDLGTLGGSCSYAYGINDDGMVVGHSQTEDGGVRAFQWTPGADSLAEVQSLDGLVSYAFGVSAQGHVSGYARLADGRYHGFVSDDGRGAVTDLGSFADDFLHAYQIGADGRVASYDAAPHGPNFAARWNPATGRLQDRSAAGSGFTVAWDVNARGVVVGCAPMRRHAVRAVMWIPGPARDAFECLFDCCDCGYVSCCDESLDDGWVASEPVAPEPINTDIGYMVGAVGMLAGGGDTAVPTSLARGVSRGRGHLGGGGGGGYYGGSGGGGGGLYRRGSAPSGADGVVPEPATVVTWIAGLLLVSLYGSLSRRRRAAS